MNSLFLPLVFMLLGCSGNHYSAQADGFEQRIINQMDSLSRLHKEIMYYDTFSLQSDQFFQYQSSEPLQTNCTLYLLTESQVLLELKGRPNQMQRGNSFQFANDNQQTALFSFRVGLIKATETPQMGVIMAACKKNKKKF